MKKSGQITVFLSMCLLCIWALLCVMLESARTAGSRYYFQVAAGGALDTLFSRYHRRLWEEYRVFALEYGKEEEIVQNLESYIQEYLSVNNWYPMNLESVEVTRLVGISDREGDLLAEEVLSFMELGAVTKLFVEPEQGESFFRDVAEASSVHTLSGIYDGQEKEARKLEQAVDKLIRNIQEQERLCQEIAQALEGDDNRGFFRAAKDYRKTAGKYPGLMRQYEKQAQALSAKNQQSWLKVDEVSGDLQEDREQLFRQQWNPYDAYLAQDGERRREFAGWETWADHNLSLLDETEQLVEDCVEHQEELEEEGDQELALAAAADHWRHGYKNSGLARNPSSGDKEKQKLLDQVRQLAEGGLVEAVMPAGTTISGAVLPKTDLPSGSMAAGSKGQVGTAGNSLAERVLINEYCGRFFTNALSEDKHPIRYELEYLLHGGGTDRENLEKTVTELFAVREGMNLIHILSDPGKRQEAEALAAAITGVTGLAPLVKIVACVVMGVWAMGESIQDLRRLMAGKKVPLWKQKGDWTTSLDNILNMGRGQMMDAGAGEDNTERGFTYEQYLKLLLLKTDPQTKHMRMLDVMQMNIRRQEPGFRMENCAYGVDIRAKACGKHMFFGLPIVENMVNGQEGYYLEAAGEKAY
ncbi:MAG: hypothetical protein HFG72_12530 [Hungatella sp.]|nr:hypothetical protein [Hungatella sp.]